jgi:hypothetical protein
VSLNPVHSKVYLIQHYVMFNILWVWILFIVRCTWYNIMWYLTFCEFESCSWQGVLCDKVCQWLVAGRCFSPGTWVSSTKKTDLLDLTEILLKVVLNTITLTSPLTYKFILCWKFLLKWLNGNHDLIAVQLMLFVFISRKPW